MTNTILVMDDIQSVRHQIVLMLSRLLIIEILEADSVQTATTLIQQYQPRLVILDIHVPGTLEMRDGVDVLKWVRSNYPQIAVIMISSHDNPLYRSKCISFGAHHFFNKTTEFEQLPQAVKQILDS